MAAETLEHYTLSHHDIDVIDAFNEAAIQRLRQAPYFAEIEVSHDLKGIVSRQVV